MSVSVNMPFLYIKRASVRDKHTLEAPVSNIKFIFSEQGTPIAGDVNGDGQLTASDVTALYELMLYNNSSHIVNGDQTGDGIITAADVTAVYKILLGND